NAGSVKITAAGTLTVGPITTSGGTINLDPPSLITLLGNLNAGLGIVLVQGNSALGNNITVTGGTVVFGGTIVGNGLALAVNSGGNTTFGSNIGTAGQPLAVLTTNA